MFVTGLGATTPSPPDGAIVTNPLPALDGTVQVLFRWELLCIIGGGGEEITSAQILYAGPAPLEVEGLGQINLVTPPPPRCFTGGGASFLSLSIQVTSPQGMVSRRSFAVSAK